MFGKRQRPVLLRHPRGHAGGAILYPHRRPAGHHPLRRQPRQPWRATDRQGTPFAATLL